jgi:isopentenyl-diphosphate delta-isomerase
MTVVLPNAEAIVAVDRDGRALDTVDRRFAHEPPGILHLAISIQLIDDQGLWILQRRSATKSLFAGLWANSCCTHPGPGEHLERLAVRRVHEELGVTTQELHRVGTYVYRAIDPKTGLVEHEFDIIYVGRAFGMPCPNSSEISDIAHLPFNDAMARLRSPDAAPWAAEVFRLATRNAASAIGDLRLSGRRR